MDQDKSGLFSLLLQNAYEEAMHVDVVKIKRRKVVLRLKVLKDALEQKDFEKANFMLLDICDKILNDPFSDEYNMTHVQVDMVVFSSAVMNVSVKYYDRTQQIITGLIMKYRNPIFYFVLGVSYFYRLSFQDAKEQFKVVINLLGSQKNAEATFPWPDTNILIISTTVEKIRENALCFLDLITLVQNIKPNIKKSSRKSKQTTIEISSLFQNTFDSNVGIGKFIQNEIYPLIHVVLSDLIKFDKSKLPSDYQKVITKVHKPLSANSESNPSINAESNPSKNAETAVTSSKEVANEKTSVKTSESTTSEKKVVLSDVVAKEKPKETPELERKDEKKLPDEKEDLPKSVTDNNSHVTVAETSNCHNKPVKINGERNILKKNQGVQVQAQTKCKKVQTFTRTATQYVQTTEANAELIEKNRIILQHEETIANLKIKVLQLSQKQKENETKLNKNHAKSKEIAELTQNNKLLNRHLVEQQGIINDFKLKLNEASSKQQEMEVNVNKTNAKINELHKENQTFRSDTEKYKETITELRNYSQILEKGAKNIGKEKEELKNVCKMLYRKYKDSYFMQIQFYQNFQKRCENVLAVLNKIGSDLTENTVPTREDCQISVREWLSALLTCNGVLQSSKKQFTKYDKLVADEIMSDISHIPQLMPIKEPYDVLVKNVPMLMDTIKVFETRLQNNHSRMKKDKSDNVQREFGTRNSVDGDVDYRKKSNFIHKTEQASMSSSRENVFTFEKLGTLPESKSKRHSSCELSNPTTSSDQNLDVASKKMQTLISYLKKKIPYRTELEITEALSIYRNKNNGSLSGITINFILYNVISILETPEKAWTTVKENYEETTDDETCPICIEPIRLKQKSVLTCKHVYHTECIREWLSRNRVCAVCRMYTVLDDDYPPLKT